MPGNSYFISLIKDLNKMKTQYPIINTDIKENIKEKEILSPKTKEIIRKNQSIEDFMKHQIPCGRC